MGVDLAALTRAPAGTPFWTLTAIRSAYWLGTAITLLWAPLRESFPPFRAYWSHGDLLFGAFAQWDAQWFLHIADHGYDSVQSTAFFPLYPLLVHGLAEVTQSTLVAGVLVSLVAGGVGVAVLHRLARPLLGAGGADDTVLLVALYPLAFVFTAAYSDGLFLALAAGAFLAGMRGQALLAGVLGGLAVGTRLIGLALLPALLVLLWPRMPAQAVRRLLPLVLLPAAVGAYALYLDRHLGDGWAFLHAQGVFWQRHTHPLGPLSGIWLALESGYHGAAELVRHLPRDLGSPGGFAKRDQWATWNVIQLLLLAGAGWLTWVAWRRLGVALGLYSAAYLLIVLTSPADVVPLVSLPRFLLADFPLFLALASLVAGRPRLRGALLIAFAAIGAAAAVGFARHVWIA